MTTRRRRLSDRRLVAFAAAALVAWLAGSMHAEPADVVISQVYGGGGNSGAPYTHDFIELYNRGSAPVPLEGLSLQYASATGTGNFGASSTQLTPLPVFTLQPGQYYLVQEAAGTGNGIALSTPDLVDDSPIAMSATAGKVALVTGTTSLGCNGSTAPCDAAALARIRDLVGYGNANFFEGAAAAPGTSNTTAALRANNGATDTDANSTDFAAGPPNPRNSAFVPPPPPPTGCAVPLTHEISAVQGPGASTPLSGTQVRVEGVVSGDFQGATELGGFFIQDPTPDADPLTSEGIFVLAGTAVTDVAVGDLVRVTGTANESFGLTRLSPAPVVDVCGAGTITPAVYDLPVPVGQTLEPFEGMLLTFPETLTATEHFQLGRFGEIVVAADGRLLQPTDRVDPGTDANAMQAENNRRRLLIDDNSNIQNPPVDDTPFLTPDIVRIGDTTSGVTGILSFGFSVYRLQPTAPIAFTRANPRPAAPVAVGGDVRVASFNTLNYFTTIDDASNDARGADSAEEFARQQAKIVQAIKGLGADVIGLMEVENNGSSAIQNLVSALNGAGAGPYAFIPEPALNPPNEFGGTFGTDAIKVAVIYKPAVVTPVGAATSSTDTVFSRPPLIQTFQLAGGSEPFTVAVNHFKSKNCDSVPGPNQDQNDGQGCFNALRVSQASALAGILSGVPNAIVIGDLNAYSKEDPIQTLGGAGFTGVAGLHVPDAERYSYLFDGQSGELDHILVGADLLDNVTGATIWHINADEPLILDYNTEFNPASLYVPDAFRSSDHDPLVMGLDLNTAPTVDAGGPYTVVEGGTVGVAAAGIDPDAADLLTYEWDLDGDGTFETPGQTPMFSAAGLDAPQTRTISVRVTDLGGLTATDSGSVSIIWNFAGFLWPVQNPPSVNVARAGWLIPFRFKLGGNQGTNILAPGYPTSQPVACNPIGSGPTMDNTAALGLAGGLHYVRLLGEYWYIWRTERTYAGTCRQFTLTLTDGTTHTALFRFIR